MEYQETEITPDGGDRIETKFVLSSTGKVDDGGGLIFNHLSSRHGYHSPTLIAPKYVGYKRDEFYKTQYNYNPPLDVFSTVSKDGHITVWLGYFNKGIV